MPAAENLPSMCQCHCAVRMYSECRSRGRKFEFQLAMVIDHEIISTVNNLPSGSSRRAVVSYWQKYVHKYWLNTVNHLED